MFWLCLGLFIAGIVLILAEFLLPGGVLGVLGVLLIIASAGVGMYAYPEMTLFIVIGQLILGSLIIILGLVVISKTGAGRGLTLSGAFTEEEGYVNYPTNTSLIGTRGLVLTALRPSGTIEIGEERIDAVSNGSFIEKGIEVRVLEVHGNRVVVEPIEV